MTIEPFKRSDFRYIDAHTHFFPEKLFKAIWSYWDRVYIPFFPTWKNIYEWPASELTAFIENEGTQYYTTLNYAHKPGLAANLNDWTFEFCKTNPNAIPFGTAHPGDDDFLEYAEKALTEYQFRGLKLQLMVTDFFIHDKRLDPLHKMMKDLDKVLIVHAGTAPGIDQQPVPGAKVGVDAFKTYLDKFPDNKVIVAHMGGYEYEKFFKIVEQSPNIYLDTAMVWPPPESELFPEEDAPGRILGDERVLSFMESCSNRILFGSDYPFIPFSYGSQIDELLKLQLSKGAFENIFYNNAKGLFDL